MKSSAREELKITLSAAFTLFVSIAFVVTVAFRIFFNSIDLNESQVREAAPATFVTILIITLLFLIVYGVIRYYTVRKPLREINQTLERLSSGDYSARVSGTNVSENYASIAKNVNSLAEELESSALMKTDFLSNISHELKTPLAVIQSYGILLEDETLSEAERQGYAREITSATRKMSDLIGNVLRLNRLETHQIQPKKQLFDLSAQLGECILQFEGVWEEKNIELSLDLPDEVKVVSDPDLLSIIWNNLLSNAFKFTEPGGTVSVQLRVEPEQTVVKVSDTGCGISSETGRHIFDKFYQGDTSHATQGNGLGLALVKRVLDILGAEISVSSVPGEGSAFSVALRNDVEQESGERTRDGR